MSKTAVCKLSKVSSCTSAKEVEAVQERLKENFLSLAEGTTRPYFTVKEEIRATFLKTLVHGTFLCKIC